jgi:diguanylate cyclase (GGDEF)-like protein
VVIGRLAGGFLPEATVCAHLVEIRFLLAVQAGRLTTCACDIHRIATIIHVDTFGGQFDHAIGQGRQKMPVMRVGAFLQHSVRSGDIACRYGGEELLLVLPDCDSSNAKTRLEHLCKETREKSFLFRGNALPSVTLSVGLAQLSEDLPSAEALITAADEALYRAKHNGRDRVEVFANEAPRKARAPKA